ncbi:hypothetical protein APA_314 [Pseudanabaena sp. lw0831]|nr:hypothetical protein APA_314 [Pseudanabaena sp. lw0831]
MFDLPETPIEPNFSLLGKERLMTLLKLDNLRQSSQCLL